MICSLKDVKGEVELSMELFPDALICGDDFGNHSGVKRAVLEMGKKHHLTVVVDKNFWKLVSKISADDKGLKIF